MTVAPDVPLPTRSPREAITDLGFDPDLVQAVILTADSAVAIAADYPEPYVQPQEA